LRKRVWCVTIRIKRSDKSWKKPLYKRLIEFLMENKIAGATVWTGVDGFGKRHRSTIQLEGITIDMPMILEIVDETSKLERLLPQIKRMINDNGIMTIHEVDEV
jgi:PII-like signaling protein